LQFNASASEDLALVAVHPTAAVGIDLERVRALTDLVELARMLLTEAERGEFDQVPSAERPDRLIDCWTRKEALSKAHGAGLRQGLQNLSLHPWPGPKACRALCSTQALWVAPLALPRPGYVAALASQAEIGAVRCGWWSPQAVH
jgi:phosphopantetheinyl transferase